MKRNIDKFLLGLLWAIALLLAASFWFDIRFGFNIFARAHWRYLANIQTTDAPVSTTFYVSLVIFTLLLPIGLYLISQPYRRIRARRTVHSITPDADLNYRDSHTPLAVLNAQPPTPITPPAAPAPVRPPELKVPPHLQHNIIPQNHNVAIATHDEPQTTEIHRDVSHIKKIISDAGYIIKKSPSIGGTRPDIWAAGSDETLIVGLVCDARGKIVVSEGGASMWKSDTDGEFESPVWKLSGMVNKLRATFDETLEDDIKVTIHAFVVMDGGEIENTETVRPIWDAFDISVFNSPNALAEFMKSNRNRVLPESEAEDFEAYSEYIDTVGEYFNSQ